MQQSQVELSRSKAECSRVKSTQVERWQNVQQSLVEPSTAMLQCSRVKYSQVEPGRVMVESSRATNLCSCTLAPFPGSPLTGRAWERGQLYLTLLHSTITLLGSTTLCRGSTCMALLDSTTPYHGSTPLYLIVLDSTMARLGSTLLHSISHHTVQ